jgi:hypothetical protein
MSCSPALLTQWYERAGNYENFSFGEDKAMTLGIIIVLFVAFVLALFGLSASTLWR